MRDPIDIDRDVRVARTLPGACYSDARFHAWALERVLARAWQPAPLEQLPPEAGAVLPFRLLAGSVDEPLILTRAGDQEVRCLANVCTHRGNLVVTEPGQVTRMLCGYHRRAFDLDGRCIGQAQVGRDCWPDFPTAEDALTRYPLERIGPLAFTAVDPEQPFAAWSAALREQLAESDADWTYAAERSPSYEVEASWILYVENFLEGLHIASVHPELSAAIDATSYATTLVENGVLQTAAATDTEAALRTGVGARYLWLFPNLMINRYAWGLSVNVVEPLAPTRTRVRYLTFVSDPAQVGRGPGGDVGLVERQDQRIVEQVQQGVSSRSYARGRYVPGWEDGVHAFHRMLAERWNVDLSRT